MSMLGGLFCGLEGGHKNCMDQLRWAGDARERRRLHRRCYHRRMRYESKHEIEQGKALFYEQQAEEVTNQITALLERAREWYKARQQMLADYDHAKNVDRMLYLFPPCCPRTSSSRPRPAEAPIGRGPGRSVC